MKLVFIIKNRDNSPFMVVSTTPDGTKFQPMTKPAKELAVFLRQEYGKTKITRAELEQTMDSSKIIEGPSPDGSVTSKKIALLNDPSKYEQQLETLPVISISEVLLSEFSETEYRNVLTFKAASFVSDQTRSSANFEIKAVRAIWDPSLAIPGTDRRGGFRCPVGTRYGGQITDRFGRSCGWGVARRIANQIADIGERMEQRDDGKRKRRLDRRNARMIRRLQDGQRTGRVEGGLRDIAQRLDGDGGAPKTPRPGRELDPAAEARRQEALAELRRLRDEALDVIRPRPRRPQEVDDDEARTPVRPPRNPRPQPRIPQDRVRPKPGEERLPDYKPNDPVGNRQKYLAEAIKRLERDKRDAKRNRPDGISNENWKKYKDYVDSLEHQFGYGGNDRFASVMSYDEWARSNNVAPRAPQVPPAPPAPARPRPARPQNAQPISPVNVLTPLDASDAGESEAFKPYVLRKYNEYAKRVREIREGGGNAGMLTRREWYAINKGNLRDAWKDVHGRSAPQDFEPPKPRRPRNNRNRRREATATDAGRSASRKPTPDDVPEPAPARPVRPARKPFNAPGQRGKVSLIDALRKRNEMRRGDAQDEDLKIVLYNGKHYVVKKAEIDRANANGANIRALPEPPQPPPARPAVVQPPAPPSPVSPTNLTPVTPPRAPRAEKVPKNNVVSLDADGAKRVNDRIVVGIKKSKPSRFNKNHGHVEIDGILVPQAVKKGNRNISLQTEANQFVKDGGDLDDVPDVFLKGAILANANYPDEPPGQIRRRFKLSSDPGDGINNRAARTKEDKTYVVEDAVSGKKYILKSPSYVENEFIGEQYAAVLGQAFGRPMSRVRIAGDIVSIQGNRGQTRNPSILVEHYGDVVDGNINNGHRIPNNVNQVSVQMVKVLDQVLSNPDRHGNNFLWIDGEKIPIDHGIYDGARGQIRQLTKVNAKNILTGAAGNQQNNASLALIQDSLSKLTVEQIDAVVDSLRDSWGSLEAANPSDKVKLDASIQAMRENLKNLKEAADEIRLARP